MGAANAAISANDLSRALKFARTARGDYEDAMVSGRVHAAEAAVSKLKAAVAAKRMASRESAEEVRAARPRSVSCDSGSSI